jgi:hypothetical protein
VVPGRYAFPAALKFLLIFHAGNFQCVVLETTLCSLRRYNIKFTEHVVRTIHSLERSETCYLKIWRLSETKLFVIEVEEDLISEIYLSYPHLTYEYIVAYLRHTRTVTSKHAPEITQ